MTKFPIAEDVYADEIAQDTANIASKPSLPRADFLPGGLTAVVYY
jgi:hypothetical protein